MASMVEQPYLGEELERQLTRALGPADAYEVVGRPGVPLESAVRPGDVILRLGTRGPPRVVRVLAAELREADDAMESEDGAERAGSGWYVRTFDLEATGRPAAPQYRRVLDTRGNGPQRQIVVRPRSGGPNRGARVAPAPPRGVRTPPQVVYAPPRPPVAEPVAPPEPVMAAPEPEPIAPLEPVAAAPEPEPEPVAPPEPVMTATEPDPLAPPEPTAAPEPESREPAEVPECQQESAEAEQVHWWDADLTEAELEQVTAPAPPQLHGFLRYMQVSWPTFAPIEARYFAALTEHLRRAGAMGSNGALDRDGFTDAIREFQANRGLTADGIPDEDTLWELQKDEAEQRDMRVERVEADRQPGSDGYGSFRLRSDVVERYRALRGAVRAAGGIVTSAGSFRDLDATVSAGRSSTSMHYTGIALDLATDTGMLHPDRDTYLVTRDGLNRWRVWCRSDEAPEQSLEVVVWRGGNTVSRLLRARAFDFTALAERHGFARIGPRKTFPANYLSAEWWHFQCEDVLVPYLSQFGIELLSISSVGKMRYDEATLSRYPAWAARKRIFHRGGSGKGWW